MMTVTKPEMGVDSAVTEPAYNTRIPHSSAILGPSFSTSNPAIC